jgi:hypothetical protein
LAEKLPGLDRVGWFAAMAPAAAPGAAIERSTCDSPDAVGAFLRSESMRLQAISQEAGVLPE